MKLREMIGSHKELAEKLDDLEKKYDARFQVVFDASDDFAGDQEKEDRVQQGSPVNLDFHFVIKNELIAGLSIQ
ncbi:MAG: hypothetical protein ABSA46_04035 [Thermodesulfovibrionales bacterium]